ncbi:MAG: hypothetical protein E7354_00375 [Clostridiales bacterium]|nr:hypothetical protein [Clostridiales bacterium]
MITKQPRPEHQGCYDLTVTDRDGKSFIMTVGGNFDLYWLPENHKENRTFGIDREDEFTFNIFEQLFDAVGKKDDKYRPVLQDNTIKFISEDWPEEEANHLLITREKDSFQIDFVQNEDKESWTYPHRGCAICFCNSGSRVPKVESLFMRMFNYLAYECDMVQCEHDDNVM